MSESHGQTIDLETVRIFEKTESQIESFFDEIGNLAKKNPDGAINKFKLGYINTALHVSNKILGDNYRPFLDFEKFDEEDIPSNSDVVLMLSQYLRSMDNYRRDHSHQASISNPRFNWNVEGAFDEHRAKRPKHFA